MSNKFNHILVIQTAFTGDVILATALIEDIHHEYPNGTIDLLVRKGNESLFIDHPIVNRVYTWDKKKKYPSLWNLYRQLKKKKWDLIINLQRFGSSGLLTWILRSTTKVGFKKNPFSFCYTHKAVHHFEKNIHEVDRNFELLKIIGMKKRNNRPKLHPSDHHKKTARELVKAPYITVSPASVWETKKMPLEKWVELSDHQDEGTNIYILGAPGDFNLGEELITQSSHKNTFNLCGMSDLLTSAQIMRDAKMNYVNDSAPTHLASSVNAPVTTFYCSTVPEFGFGPLSDHRTVIETEENLSCRPCGLHGHKSCPEGHFKCGHGISVTKLLSLDE